MKLRLNPQSMPNAKFLLSNHPGPWAAIAHLVVWYQFGVQLTWDELALVEALVREAEAATIKLTGGFND